MDHDRLTTICETAARVAVISRVTGTVTHFDLWANWAITAGDTFSLQALADIGQELRTTGSVIVGETLLVLTSYEPRTAAA